jgi:glycopeptide antibiotics resistance protein
VTELQTRYPRTRIYLVIVCTLTLLLEVVQLLFHLGAH